MPVISKDSWDIEGVVTATRSVATEAMEAPDASFSTAAITSALIPSLNGGTPMVTGGGGSFGSASQIPTIQVAANGAVTIGTANIADNFTSNINSTSDTQAASANALNQVYQMVLSANGGGGANVLDSVTNTSITLAAAANSVKFAYDTAIAANSYAASIAATAFANAVLRTDAAYANAIAYSGNAALAFANAAARADAAYSNAIAYSGNAALAFANAALRADAAYSNAIAYSGNAALAYANAIAYVDTNAAFRGVAQTISAVWTHSANIIPSTNGIFLGSSSRRWGIAGTSGNFSADVDVGGNLAVTGNLTINGTTTTFNSTSLSVDDPIITLGGDTAPGADDNKDRGIEYRWHDGAVAKVGFFGFDDSTGEFTFIPDATNTSEVFSGTAGNVNFTKGTFTTLIGSLDASNVASGTLPEARLTQANATTNGIMRVIDSVVNTSITIAAAANSVKQAFDTATLAYAAANAASAGGVLSFNSRTGAVTFANTDAESLTYRWTGLHTYAANLTIHPTTTTAYLFMRGISNSTVNYQKFIGFQGGAAGSTNRWLIGTASALESGSDAGSNLVINRYNDAGTFQDQIYIDRANGRLVTANGIFNSTGLTTLATVNVTSTSEKRGVTTFFANAIPSSNAINLGTTTARWIINANTLSMSGAVAFASSLWQTDAAGAPRFYFAPASHSYYSTPSSLHVFRGLDDTDAIYLSSNSTVRNFYPQSNTGANLGRTGERWTVYANSISTSANITVSTGITLGSDGQNRINGASAIYWFQDRSGSSYFGLYATANVGRLYTPAGVDAISVTAGGNTYFANSAYYNSIPLSTQANTLGLAHIIPEAQNGAYTIALDDFNQMKRFVTGAAASWTIANNSSTAYPLGFTFIARNVQANTLTVARGTGVTLRKAGSTTNTDVTIAQWGYASFTQEDTNVWVASGTY